ncbi:hypothetical protein [Lysinibacillus xylanilyticus]|uniref:hypothetical protein n=1 Tax=Lysinibacillus xylanilyticus TaxID=582475 RepID=UPI000A92EDD3|nr:hypothetical protein [Lysinibacillus xylanilyticus]
MFSVAKAKRQLQMFYLCESEASTTNVLSVRKRSNSNNKALSRNGNQPPRFAERANDIIVFQQHAKETNRVVPFLIPPILENSTFHIVNFVYNS